MNRQSLSQVFSKVSADLRVQSMMFDMDIDWETLSLVKKTKAVPGPSWLVNWKTKREQSDFNEYYDIDKE